LAAQPPDPKGEVCERCGKRGIVAPVTVVPIDGPVGRIDLLCRDCAEVPEPKGVPGPVAPGGGGAAEPLYQWVPRSDLDAANARILAANDECEYAIKLGREAAKERDAANERARIAEAALAGSYREDKDFAEAIWVEHQRIEAERDAALATIDRWKRNTQDSDSAIAKLTAERDLWKTTSDAHAMVLLTTEQERDAALASAAGMREALAKLWQYVNKHCGDWYMDAERRTIATLIEGPGGALSAAPSDYLARVRAEALRGALPKCNGRWSGGSGGHRQHEPCGATATWFDPPYWYCEEHVHDDEVEVYVMDWRDAIRALAPPSPTKEPSR
jgi:hypothetical protein